jgi:hypothetical protein
MSSYIITFTDIDGDTCEVDQPARSAVDAVAAVHTVYGHFSAPSWHGYRHYQAHTVNGIETYRVHANSRPVLV